MMAADPGNGNAGDIEENISRHDNPAVDATTNPSPSMLTTLVGSVTSVVYVIYTLACSIIYVTISYPFSLTAHLVSFSLTGTLRPVCLHCLCRCRFKEYCRSHHIRTKDVFNQINAFETTLYRIKRIIIVSSSRLGCLLLLWLLVNLCVPKLRRATLGGSLLWKWSLFGTVVSLGYPSTYVAVNVFGANFVYRWFTEANDALYYISYLEGSVRGLIYLSWILLVWLLYFRTHQGLDLINSRAIHKYVTCTLVSFQVGATLWGLKRVVWLKWRANAIYERFKPRILRAGFHLFFLALIVNRNPLRNFPSSWLEQYTSSRKMSLYQISWIAYLVAHLAKLESRETDDASEIIEKYQKIIEDNDILRSEEYVREEAIRNLTRDKYEADLFLEQLQLEYPSKSINEMPFLEWTVDTHKNCVSMGRTLLDAFATVSVLDTILTCCIVVLIIVLWLLIAELATTTVLVVIASPFLAFTFVFGDTCKTFFQGVVFSFIIHPFDVGERCIIDGTEVMMFDVIFVKDNVK